MFHETIKYFELFLPNCLYHLTLKQVSAPGKVILITGCESPLAWFLARKLDELGWKIYFF